MTISSSVRSVVGVVAHLADCPGQIELYTHFPIMSRLVSILRNHDIRLCATYLLESQFMEDRAKYFSGVLSAMSCMINLEIPHLNIMSKMDLSKKRKRDLERCVARRKCLKLG